MVNSCSVNGCTNRYKKKTDEMDENGTHIQFHRFPLKRPDVLNQWIKAVDRDKWTPTAYSFLCSEHFKNDDYQTRPGADKKLLKETAVPSIFKSPNDIKKPKKKRCVLKRQLEISNKVHSSNAIIAKNEDDQTTPEAEIELLKETTEPSIKKSTDVIKKRQLEMSDEAHSSSAIIAENEDDQTTPEAEIELLKETAVPSIKKSTDVIEKPKKKHRVLKRQLEKSNEMDISRSLYLKLFIDQEVQTEVVQDPEEVQVKAHSSNTELYLDKEIQTEVVENYKEVQVKMYLPSLTEQKLRRKIKILQQRFKRRNEKLSSLQKLVDILESKLKLQSNIASTLEGNFNEFLIELFQHEAKNKNVSKLKRDYSAVVKNFAKTVYSYSPKAYNYIGTLLALPHPKTIGKWGRSVKESDN